MSEIVIEAVRDNTEAPPTTNIISEAVTDDIAEAPTTINVTLDEKMATLPD